MFRLATMQDIAVKRFPELFSVLLITLGCYIGTAPPVCTPQHTKSKKGNLTFVPNRSAYKLAPARYDMLQDINYCSFSFVCILNFRFEELLEVWMFVGFWSNLVTKFRCLCVSIIWLVIGIDIIDTGWLTTVVAGSAHVKSSWLPAQKKKALQWTVFYSPECITW